MDWKWLFIYPEQHIASVNLAVIPTDQPVDFMVTSDTVMNSFWVPGLGGQIYSMPGMITQLHEQANKPGDYLGSPANIAGHGFSRMDFTVRASSPASFAAWVKHAQQANRNLTTASYAELAKPSSDVPVQYYSPVEDGLFDTIVMNYMMPTPQTEMQTAPAQPMKHEHSTMPMSMPSMEMNE
jgi:cytochrome o ubiquinol oxidase subunit 2